MRILTAENNCFEMTDFPEEVDDLRFAVLDNSNPKDPDYFFIPLMSNTIVYRNDKRILHFVTNNNTYFFFYGHKFGI